MNGTLQRTRNSQELLKAVQACQITQEAAGLVKHEVAAIRAANPHLNEAEAHTLVLESIGFVSGALGNRGEAARVLQLFDTRHPILGPVEKWPDTPEHIAFLAWNCERKNFQNAQPDGS